MYKYPRVYAACAHLLRGERAVAVIEQPPEIRHHELCDDVDVSNDALRRAHKKAIIDLALAKHYVADFHHVGVSTYAPQQSELAHQPPQLRGVGRCVLHALQSYLAVVDKVAPSPHHRKSTAAC